MTPQDDVIKWKHFPRNWPFVRGIHRSPVNSPHKGQWRGALMFSLICVWINDWVNNREAGHLRRYRAHYDVIVMICAHQICCILLYWHIRIFQHERRVWGNEIIIVSEQINPPCLDTTGMGFSKLRHSWLEGKSISSQTVGTTWLLHWFLVPQAHTRHQLKPKTAV